MLNIKTLSFNIHKGIGWGKYYFSLDQIQEQLHTIEPDVVFLQEVRGHQFDHLKAGLWDHHCYGMNAIYQTGHHGNVILSKFPIVHINHLDLSVRRLDRKGMLHAIVSLPNNQKLHLLCIHLGLLFGDRNKQMNMIMKYMHINIPDHEPIIMGGDFNDWKGHIAQPLITELQLKEAFLHCRQAYAKSFPAWMPMFKLDRIYYRGFTASSAEKMTQPAWKYLSDHLALLVHFTLDNVP